MATSWGFINPGGADATPAVVASPAAAADPKVGLGIGALFKVIGLGGIGSVVVTYLSSNPAVNAPGNAPEQLAALLFPPFVVVALATVQRKADAGHGGTALDTAPPERPHAKTRSA